MANVIRKISVLPAIVLLAACVDSGGSGGGSDLGEEFDFVGMMASYADNVIVPSYARFGAETRALSAADGPTGEFCAAIGTPEEGTRRAAARAAWRDTMSAWQESEVYLVGPAAANGEALRNRIYSYASGSPLSTCAIDQAVVLAEDPDFDLQTRSLNQRGLEAIEYLLFNDDPGHSCPDSIEETRGWDSRPEIERRRLRCEYALDLAADVHSAGASLLDAWQPQGDNYRSEFVDPTNLDANFEALSDALFYIELETKDRKLGIPTGINAACSRLTCPEVAESRFSDTALANLRANLVGFRDGLTGGLGLGFDDIIAEKGFSSVNQEFLDNVEAAIALIDSMPASLQEQIDAIEASGSDAECINSAANPDSVQTVPACSLHGYLKRITDSLRTEFITAVDVDLPDGAGGDND